MKKNRGFTLIEMVIMIGICAVLFISISRATNTMIWRFNQMRNYRIALHLAKARIATFNNLPIASLPAAGTIDYSDASYPGFTIRQITSTPYNTAGPPNYFVRQIRIEVFTQKDGDLVNIYTYRTNAAAFGDGKIGNTDGI